ncbi:MAG: DoxX family protein [Xanthobacteraceae bacterium]|nr:DoxX family protein [Xanthobacteraceae bacterium]
MPRIIARLLDWPAFAITARAVLTFPFWASGFSKLFDFGAGVAEMQQYGLEPAAPFNVAVIVTLLAGSASVIANRWLWLGAGALAVFTALTIPIVHTFWKFEGERAQTALFFVTEHISMIGGLMLAALLSHLQSGSGQAKRG